MESKETINKGNIIKSIYPQGIPASSIWYQGDCIFRSGTKPPTTKYFELINLSSYNYANACLVTKKGVVFYQQHPSSYALQFYFDYVQGNELITTYTNIYGGLIQGEMMCSIPLYENEMVLLFQKNNSGYWRFTTDTPDDTTYLASRGGGRFGSHITNYYDCCGVEYNGLYIYPHVFADYPYPDYSYNQYDSYISQNDIRRIPYITYVIDSDGIMHTNLHYGISIPESNIQEDVEYKFSKPILLNLCKNPVTGSIFGRLATAIRYNDVSSYSPNNQEYKCGIYELTDFDEYGNFEIVGTIEQSSFIKIGENPEFRKRQVTSFRKLGDYVIPIYTPTIYDYEKYKYYNYVFNFEDQHYIDFCKQDEAINFGNPDVIQYYYDYMINFDCTMFGYDDKKNTYYMLNSDDISSSDTYRSHWKPGIYKSLDINDNMMLESSTNSTWDYVKNVNNDTGYGIYPPYNNYAQTSANNDTYMYFSSNDSHAFVLRIDNI